MTSPFPPCIQCNQQITQHVCEKCFTQQLAKWLQEYQADPFITEHIITSLKNNHESFMIDGTKCSLCHAEMLSICKYCFFFKVERILQSLPLSPEARRAFIHMLNIQLYSREAQ